MTNAELIAKIKSEIERLKGICTAQIKANPEQTFPFVMEMTGYDKLLSFLSAIESEKPIDLDELMKEAQRYYFDNFEYLSSDQSTLSTLTNIARHFAKWGAEHAKIESEKPVPKDIEEAADNHIREVVDAAGHPGWDWEAQDIAESFIAGAKWQKDALLEWAKQKQYESLTIVADNFWQEVIDKLNEL